MTQGTLFIWLLTTLFMLVAGADKIRVKDYTMGAILLGVPMVGWLTFAMGVWFGQ